MASGAPVFRTRVLNHVGIICCLVVISILLMNQKLLSKFYRESRGGVIKVNKASTNSHPKTRVETLVVGESEKWFMEMMAQRMRDRRELLQAKCKKMGLDTESAKPVKFVLAKKYKFAYCFIPKTGCTNWKKVIMLLNGYAKSQKELDAIDHDRLHGIVAKKYLTLNVGVPPAIKDYMKFVVVRDPYERLVSAYRNKIAKQDNLEKPQYYKISYAIRQKYGSNYTSDKTKRKEATFEEFVDYLIDGNNSDKFSVIENHWSNYNRVCSMCTIHYDVIAHMETIEEDSRYMLMLLKAPKHVQLPKGYNNTGSSVINVDSVNQYYRDLSPDKMFKLYETYVGDFQMFGYPFRDLRI
uniref:carbohydrate sulfotransferase 9-like n=1 Tax=Ciona intestinalis TaxID=7719 RepID=UPI00006A5799|nr:carbohydrate sulfotransferase 9-like [Ciona intestinalis]|eukprot:XP_002127582.1 carbohydrate sulfotransferase 9-like [Ciona intestinalis]